MHLLHREGLLRNHPYEDFRHPFLSPVGPGISFSDNHRE